MTKVRLPVPIFARFGGKETELGTLTIEVNVTMVASNGKVAFQIAPETVFSKILEQFYADTTKSPEFFVTNATDESSS